MCLGGDVVERQKQRENQKEIEVEIKCLGGDLSTPCEWVQN